MARLKLIITHGRSKLQLLRLFVLVQIFGLSLAQPQPLMNQLAAIFRARSPWPTSFPSNPITDSSMNNNPNSINYSDNEFTHLNDLLTSQNLKQFDPTSNGGGGGNEGFLGLGPSAGSNSFPNNFPTGLISSSLPPIIVNDSDGGSGNSGNKKPKGILIAHPVLGPNQLSMDPDLKYNFQQQRPRGSTNVKYIQTIMNDGLYSSSPGNGNGKQQGQLVVPSLQTLISEGLKNHLSQRQNQRFKQQMHKLNLSPQIFSMPGSHQAGQRVIGIPIPSKLPFLPNPNMNPNLLYNQYNNNHQEQQNNQQSPNQGQFNYFNLNPNQQQQQQQNLQNFQFHSNQNQNQNFQNQNPNNPIIKYFPFPGESTQIPHNLTPSNSNQFNPSQVDMSSKITPIITTTTISPINKPSTTTSRSTSPSTKTTSQSPSTTTTTLGSTTKPSASSRSTFSTTTFSTTTTTEKPLNYPSFSYYPTQNTNQNQGHGLPSYNSFQQEPKTTTQTPWTHFRSGNGNNIQEVIINSHLSQDQKSPQQLITSPSTLVGSFSYPDPPSPPNLQSMNTRYELQNQDVLMTQYIPTKSPYFTASTYTSKMNNAKKKNSRGYFEPSISSVSPFPSGGGDGSLGSINNAVSNSISVSGSFSASSNGLESNTGTTNSKWKFKDDQKNSNSINQPQFDKGTSFQTNFRPSPQLHAFEDSTSGLREYITVNPPSNRDSKSLFPSQTQSSKSSITSFEDLPTMESGFRPFNHFAYVNGVPSASISSTTENSVLNLIRNEFVKDMKKKELLSQWSEPDPTGSTFSIAAAAAAQKSRQDRKFNSASVAPSLISSSGYLSNGYYNIKNPYQNPSPPVSSTYINYPNSANSYSNANTVRYVPSTSTSSPPLPLGDQWVGRLSSSSSSNSGGGHRSSTSSSELFEDWLAPRPSYLNSESSTTPTTTTTQRPIYYSGKTKNPLECDKFHRFGFCPVTTHYPLEQVESIGSRCSTLLSHLIAPLPKTDVRYDVIVPKNGSSYGFKGRSAAPSGWSWKSFPGKPVCDTKEIKIVPGWAKNEQGEWLVILQTEKWQQEAQISLCTSQGGYHCNPSDGQKCQTQRTKCVQRFTAQRLVVLDPEDHDRCPVVRSVFLPSACVCLNDEDHHHHHQGQDKGGKHHKHHHHTTTTKNKSNNHPSQNQSNGHSSGHSSTSSSTSTSNSRNNKKSTNSKNKGGRSLSMNFFGLDGIELETAADSSTSLETFASQNNKKINDPKTNEENKKNSPRIISVKNPSNATTTKVMVITSEKVSEDSDPVIEESTESGRGSGSGSTESSVETQGSNKSSDTFPSLFFPNISTTKSSSISSSSSSLGSAFIVTTSKEENTSSNNSLENETE